MGRKSFPKKLVEMGSFYFLNKTPKHNIMLHFSTKAENLKASSHIIWTDTVKHYFFFSFHLIFRVFVYVDVSPMYICSSDSYLDFYLSTCSAYLRQIVKWNQ